MGDQYRNNYQRSNNDNDASAWFAKTWIPLTFKVTQNVSMLILTCITTWEHHKTTTEWGWPRYQGTKNYPFFVLVPSHNSHRIFCQSWKKHLPPHIQATPEQETTTFDDNSCICMAPDSGTSAGLNETDFVFFKSDSIYHHKLLRFNFTTYAVQCISSTQGCSNTMSCYLWTVQMVSCQTPTPCMHGWWVHTMQMLFIVDLACGTIRHGILISCGRDRHKLTCRSIQIWTRRYSISKILIRIHTDLFPRVTCLNRSGTCNMTDHPQIICS